MEESYDEEVYETDDAWDDWDDDWDEEYYNDFELGYADVFAANLDESALRIKLAKEVKSKAGKYKIGLNRSHSNPKPNTAANKKDGATPHDNIWDTADGNQAKTSKYGDAGGKPTDLSPALLQAILDLYDEYGMINISEIAGGDHSSGSAHYSGKAIDVTWLGKREKDGVKRRRINGMSEANAKKLGKEVYAFLVEKGYKVDPPYDYKDTVYEDRSHFHIHIKGYNPPALTNYSRFCDDPLPSYADLTVNTTTVIKSLPCSKGTNAESVDLENGTLYAGDVITATALWKNDQGNYWYEVSHNGERGFVYAGNVTAAPRFDCVTLTGNPQVPSGQVLKGSSLSLSGVIDAGYLTLETVGAYVLKVVGMNYGAIEYTGVVRHTVPNNTKSWNLGATYNEGGITGSLSSLCNIKNLPLGKYQYIVAATVKNNIARDGQTLETDPDKTTSFRFVKQSSFSIVDNIFYTITYISNGGSDAPGFQKAKGGTTINLSDGSGMKRTGHTFVGWAALPQAKECDYKPGEAFTVESSMIFFAIWRENVLHFSFDANGGSGSMDSYALRCGWPVLIPYCEFKRTNYEFAGWNLYCPGVQKWYAGENGWLTEAEISAGGHEKKLYTVGERDQITNEKLMGTALNTQFVLKAVWRQTGGTYQNIAWNFSNGTLTITGSGNMPVYDTAPWDNYKSQISRIVIGSGITGISDNAFSGYPVSDVSLPSSLELIGRYAFHRTQNLKQINFPEGLKSIKSGAFSSAGLERLDIPASVQEIELSSYMNYFIRSPFSECPLTSISVAPGNAYYCSSNNALLTADRKYLLEGAIISGEYWIPDGVEYINSYSFYQKVRQPIELVLPGTLIEIGPEAFSSNDLLYYRPSNTVRIHSNTSMTYFPDSLQEIGYGAFAQWSGLREIRFSSSSKLKYLDSDAFGGCYECVNLELGPDFQFRSDGSFNGTPFDGIFMPDEDEDNILHITIHGAPRQIGHLGEMGWNGATIYIHYSSNCGWVQDSSFINTRANVIWLSSTPFYKVIFDSNDGSGNQQTQIYETSASSLVCEPPESLPTRINYKFKGWSLESYAQEATYPYDDSITIENLSAMSNTITLYAVWEVDLTKPPDHSEAIGAKAGSSNQNIANWFRFSDDWNMTAVQFLYNYYFSESFLAKNYCPKCYVTALYTGILSRMPLPEEEEPLIELLEDGNACWEEIFNLVITSDAFHSVCQEKGITNIGGPIEVPAYGTYPTGLCTDNFHTESAEHVCTLAFVEAQDADCTEPGFTAYYYCEDCGALYTDAEGKTRVSEHSLLTVQPLGHSFVNGYCSRCDSMDEDAQFNIILYYSNGGTNEPETQYRYQSEPQNLREELPAWEGYTFLGWGEAADSVLPVYQPGDQITGDMDLELYAVWRFNEPDAILPSTLTQIGDGAFEGSGFFYVVLPDTVTHIGAYAFADCPILRHIYLPESLEFIDDHAFDGAVRLCIHGMAGGKAQAFADNSRLSFIPAT